MSGYLYRGTSLSAANREEFALGKIEGHTAKIYRGELDTETPHATQARGTPLDELPWWMPEGEDRPYLVENQGVTGGITSYISTAISFSGGIPLVLYLNESALNGTATAVRYGYSWFGGFEGALSWVYGKSVDGEVWSVSEGLIGLTTTTEDGPAVWEWGDSSLNSAAMKYQDERESLVFSDHIDVSGAMDTVAVMLEGRRAERQALASLDGYKATSYGDQSEENVNQWEDDRVLRTLHQEVKDRAAMALSDLWIINLETTFLANMQSIPEDAFGWAYDGQTKYEDPDAIPPRLLGRA